jgi:hypothetical protein
VYAYVFRIQIFENNLWVQKHLHLWGQVIHRDFYISTSHSSNMADAKWVRMGRHWQSLI